MQYTYILSPQQCGDLHHKSFRRLTLKRMQPVPPLRGIGARSAGFSLVEVLMAIGIVAFAYIAMIGLLPAGMTSFNKAIDNSLGSQIMQRIATEAQQTDFDTLTGSSGGTTVTLRYFDAQGNELIKMAGSLYTAEVTVLAPTTLPSTNIPGSPSLATVTIRLAHNPGENPMPFDPTAHLRIRTLTALIAKK